MPLLQGRIGLEVNMEINDVISDYILMASSVAAQLRRELGEEDLLAGWRQHRIPQRGTLSDGTQYQFHGKGCSVERDNIGIDFDFGNQGRTDGFDSWRLWLFTEQFPAKYPEFKRREVIEEELQSLVESGAVCPSGEEDDHLLYLRVEVRDGNASKIFPNFED